MNGRPWWVTGLAVTGVGWYIATAIVAGTLAGYWLDRAVGTKPLFLLLGLLVGMVLAFYGTYRMLVTFLMGQRDANGTEGHRS